MLLQPRAPASNLWCLLVAHPERAIGKPHKFCLLRIDSFAAENSFETTFYNSLNSIKLGNLYGWQTCPIRRSIGLGYSVASYQELPFCRQGLHRR